jgi:hypothetical protein
MTRTLRGGAEGGAEGQRRLLRQETKASRSRIVCAQRPTPIHLHENTKDAKAAILRPIIAKHAGP